MSDYGQAREMSAMVSALTRVVSGEGVLPLDRTSAPATVTSQLPIKRERENEAPVVTEEVLRYYRGFAQPWWAGSRQAGDTSTSSVQGGELPLAISFLVLFYFIFGLRTCENFLFRLVGARIQS